MQNLLTMNSTRKICFLKTEQQSIIALSSSTALSKDNLDALKWLFSGAEVLENDKIEGLFVGPRREMITPWSTTAVEITQNMNICGIERIEEYFPVKSKEADYDVMLQRMYDGLDQDVFTVNREPQDIVYITDFGRIQQKKKGLGISAKKKFVYY